MHLIVQEVPEQPKNLRINLQQSRSLQLTWSQPFAGNSPIEEYIIQYKPISHLWQSAEKISVIGAQSLININNLHPATSYHTRIAAVNKLGTSEFSEMVQVTTLEEVPSGPPQNVHGEAKSSTEILIHWDAPEKDEWNGNLLGYYVGYKEATQSTTEIEPTPAYNFKTVEVRSHFGGETLLENLNKFTQYNIVVQAYTSQGSGPLSKEIQIGTLEDGKRRFHSLIVIHSNNSELFQFSAIEPTRKSKMRCPQFDVNICHMVTAAHRKSEWQIERLQSDLHRCRRTARKRSASAKIYQPILDGGKSAKVHQLQCLGAGFH